LCKQINLKSITGLGKKVIGIHVILLEQFFKKKTERTRIQEVTQKILSTEKEVKMVDLLKDNIVLHFVHK